MKISSDTINLTCSEEKIFESIMSLNNKDILELGCGDAKLTRLIATNGRNRRVVATEVDIIQHDKNSLIDDLPNVSFELAASENIPAIDNTFDIVFMFKSFHHVEPQLMTKALQEIRRVLKPQGMAYISEPVFAGEFNEILRLFHDEELPRKAAFDALEKAVNENSFTLKDEIFFYAPLTFENFDAFENKIIASTHSEHHLSDELYRNVKHRFTEYYKRNNGTFLIPVRVDLLSCVYP